MDEKRTEERVAIVTGGNSGIGEAISMMLGRRGYRVVVAGRRGKENERVAGKITELGPGRGVSFESDVSEESECLALVEKTIEREGRLDLLEQRQVSGLQRFVRRWWRHPWPE